MLNSYYTEKLLGLQEVSIKKICETKEIFEIFIEQPRKQCVCPACGKVTDKIHDYRLQRVKELPVFEKPFVLVLRKRRYACSCGKRFAEPNTFLPKYQRMTQRTILALIDRLRDCRSYSSVAREFRLSVPTVIRFFRNVQYSKPTQLPEVIGIDEFKGNSGGEKFHGILTDLGKKQVVDVLKTRYEHDLCDYFKKYDRSGVKYFVSDMYKPYAEIVACYFPNATYVIDKYHWIRQAIWAFEAVRKEVQKQFSKQHLFQEVKASFAEAYGQAETGAVAAGSRHAGHFPDAFHCLFSEGTALRDSKRDRSGSAKEAVFGLD